MRDLGRRLDMDLGQAIDHLPDAIVVADLSGQIVYANRRAEDVFRVARSELVGRALDVLIPERLRAAHRRHVAAFDTVAGARDMHARSAVELVGLRADGTEFPAEIAIGPIATERGRFVCATIRDVEERRRLERIALAEQTRSEFFASVSHELRTPLTSIVGFCELAQESAGLTEELAGHLERIQRNAEREIQLVNDLLLLTSIDELGPSRHARLINLAGLVGTTAQSWIPSAESASVTLDASPPDPAVYVRSDPDRVCQVLDSLFSNAIKFAGAGGWVRVEVSSTHDEATVVVVDSGPGVTAADAERIFERLYRGDHALESETPGAGLGLAIARGVADALGGRVDLLQDSIPGASFRFVLPLADIAGDRALSS